MRSQKSRGPKGFPTEIFLPLKIRWRAIGYEAISLKKKLLKRGSHGKALFNVPASFEVSSILMGQTLIIQIGIIKVYYYIQAT